MKIGIMYYSRTGNTRQAAKILEEKFKEKKSSVDLIEIEHVSRPGFFTAGRAASKQEELPMKNTDFDLGKYDVIIVGSPTWAGKPSPFIISFMNKAENIRGKKMAVFSTGMSPIDKRDQFLEIIKNVFKNTGIGSVGALLALNYKRGRLANGQQNIDTFVKNCLEG